MPATNDPNWRLLLFQETLKHNLAQPLLGAGTIGIDADAAVLTFTVAARIDGLDARGLGLLLETTYDATRDLRDDLGGDTEEATETETTNERQPDVSIRD